MNIWILKDAEPLPLKAGQRALRAGLLAEELGRRGHRVQWWCSTFSHHRKDFIFDADTRRQLMPNVTLLAMHVGRYGRNVSLSRLLHHRRLGWRFRELAEREPAPDLIVSALPNLDFPYQAAHYAAQHRVPLVVDVRDPWPDVFADKAPAPVRPLVRWLTLPERRRAAFSLNRADAVTAVSKGFLRWAYQLSGRPQAAGDRVFYLGHSGFETTGDASARICGLVQALKGRLVFTFVGTFGHSYEVELIARAARHFQASRRDVAFVLIGDGHQRKVLEEQYRDVPNLTLTGWLDTRDIAAVLKATHIGLVPCRSLPNTVPNKPFEYLAAGLPLLSSLEGEMEDIIEAHGLGLSYRAGDLGGLIGAVERMAANRDRLEEWSANARRAFAAHFCSERIYPEFAGHVERVAETRRAASGAGLLAG
jgi:glycosyltransferase involved in cell wall biosynthesis